LLVFGTRPSVRLSGLAEPGPLSESTGPLFDATAFDLPPTLTAAATAVSICGTRLVRSVAGLSDDVPPPTAVRLRLVAEAKASPPTLTAVDCDLCRRGAWTWRDSDADAGPGRPVTATRPSPTSPQMVEYRCAMGMSS